MLIRDIRPEEYAVLPAIENTADAMFHVASMASRASGEPDAWKQAGYVLVHGDPPIGFAVVTVADGNAHLEQVSVHTDHSRQGISARLIEAAAGGASSLGYQRMTLLTYADVPWNAP